MDWPHIHIMLNHFPIILAVVGALAVILGMVRSRRGIWLYATASLTLAAITAVPTYFTGQPAEHALGRPWYIPRGVIGTHEDVARIAAILVVVAGLIAAFAWRRLVRYPREVKMPGGLRATLFVTSVAAAGAIGYASWLGARIIHDAPVLHGPAPAGYALPGPTVSPPATAPAAPPALPADSGRTVSPPGDTTSSATTAVPPVATPPRP